jgi:hypothetical protein
LATWSLEDTQAGVAAANVTAGSATFGSGLTGVVFVNSATPGSGRAYSASGWTTGTTVDGTDYLEVSIAPASGYALNLTGFSFVERRSGTGISAYEARYSTNDFATFISIGTAVVPDNDSYRAASLPFAASELTGTVKIRVFGYAAEGTGGTWRFDNVVISGTVTTAAPTPTLTPDPAALSLTYATGTGPATSSYLLDGSNLTADGTITITSGDATKVEVSTDGGMTYGSTATFGYTGTSFADRAISVRLVAGLAAGTYPVTLTNAGGGATTNVTVNGSVEGVISIAAARATVAGTTVLVEGRVTVDTQYGGRQVFIQDETGGISVFGSTAALNLGTLAVIGDKVRVRGTIGAFNNLEQLTVASASDYVKLPDANAPVTPKVITPSEIAANKAQLVTIENAAISPNTVTDADPRFPFTPAANLNLTAGGQTTQLRIDPNTNLPGYYNPTGSASVTGIAGVFQTTPQLLPRFRTDFSTPLDEFNPANGTDATFDVAAWNIEWYGSTGNGPTNEPLQQQNAKTVLETLNADVFLLTEIVDTVALKANLPVGYAASFSPFVSAGGSAATAQKVTLVYKTATVSIVSQRGLLVGQGPANAWASGRYPYLWVVDATVGGITKRIHLVGVHAKANENSSPADAQEAYDRRKADVDALEDSLTTYFADVPILMLGDFNDDVDFTVANVPTTVSTYQAFNENPAYTTVTRTLSTEGFRSFLAQDNMIDHLLVSDEITLPALGGRTTAEVGILYVQGSATTADPYTYLANYGNTTSDHLPILARFQFTGEPTPVTYRDFRGTFDGSAVRLTWRTATELDNDRFEVERSRDAKTFERIGTVPGRGTTSQGADYAFRDEQPLPGTNYYRLRQVDRDGTPHESRSIAVRTDQAARALHVYPNPTSDRWSWEVPALADVRRIRVYSLAGRLLAESADGTPSISARTLPAGTYLLEVQTGGGVIHRQRVVRQ